MSTWNILKAFQPLHADINSDISYESFHYTHKSKTDVCHLSNSGFTIASYFLYLKSISEIVRFLLQNIKLPMWIFIEFGL